MPMKTLIVYGSKYGCTEECACLLRDELGETDLADVGRPHSVSLDAYDTVLIGSPVYIGKLDKNVIQFCNARLATLTEKRIGLFICAGEPDKAIEQLEAGFPKELVEVARAKGYFGYRIQLKKLSLLDQILLTGVGKRRNEEDIRRGAIDDFAKTFLQEH